MLWVPTSAFEPSPPPHCTPSNEFLLRFSSAFHTCIPTPLAFVSNTLGILSICAWLFSQAPQIYKNWKYSSTSGLSIFFLVEWCLGDLSNLLGALFTHQASWQVVIGSYYVFVDICLVSQWFWYEKLRHGRIIRTVWPRKSAGQDAGIADGMQEVIIEGVPTFHRRNPGVRSMDLPTAQDRRVQGTRPQNILRKQAFGERLYGNDDEQYSSLAATPSGTIIHRIGPASPMPSPSARTLLMIACLAAIVQASPAIKQTHPATIVTTRKPTRLENAGTILSWTSTLLYLGSRLPQLIKNWRRKSTAGLSPLLFAAAFCGNLFYSLALLTNPRAWNSFAPYGEGGWTGPEGSDRAHWVAAALPFFLGAAGVLGLDASVGIQFVLYGDSRSKVVVIEESKGRRWRWRRVDGWMRGWTPRSEGECNQREALLQRSDQHGEGYGAL